MIDMPAAQVWFIIIALGLGTLGLRASFLMLLGDRELPEWLLRHLRYTPVAVIPGLIAPAVLWPEATGGATDPARLGAAAMTLALGVLTRNTLVAILGGGVTLYALLAIL